MVRETIKTSVTSVAIAALVIWVNMHFVKTGQTAYKKCMVLTLLISFQKLEGELI